MFTPYDWQEECVERWFAAGRKGICEVATGAGKTSMAIMAAKRLEGEIEEPLTVYVVVPRVALASQWENAFAKAGWTRSKIRRGRDGSGDVNILVINTARTVLPRMLLDAQEAGRHTMVIVDECHHLGGDENAKCLEAYASPRFVFPLYSVMGLTATHGGVKSRKIAFLLGDVIMRYGAGEAIRDNIICPYKLFDVATRLNDAEGDDYDRLTARVSLLICNLTQAHPELFRRGVPLEEALEKLKGDEDAKALKAALQERRRIIVMSESRLECAMEILTALRGRGRTIVFTERISQLEALRAMVEQVFPGEAVAYHSGMSKEEKERGLEAFRGGWKRIMLCCRALDEGLDVPSVDVGIVVSSTSVERQRIQRLGRLLRKSGGKDFSTVYYLYTKDTVDQATLLKGAESEKVSFHKGSFTNRRFYKFASAVAKRERPRLDSSQRAIFLEAFERGEILPDYLLSPAEIDARIASETDPGERVYLRVMKLVAAEREAWEAEHKREHRNIFLC